MYHRKRSKTVKTGQGAAISSEIIKCDDYVP